MEDQPGYTLDVALLFGYLETFFDLSLLFLTFSESKFGIEFQEATH